MLDGARWLPKKEDLPYVMYKKCHNNNIMQDLNHFTNRLSSNDMADLPVELKKI